MPACNRTLIVLSLLSAVSAHAQPILRHDGDNYTLRLESSIRSEEIRNRNLTATLRPHDSIRMTPALDLSMWNGECSFTIDLSTPQAPLADAVVSCDSTEQPSRMSIVSHDITHRLLAAPTGGLEWEIVLASRPVSRVFRYNIETNGLDFWYQDTLTDIEQRDGSRRPDSVIGSWAVYRSKGGGDHRHTGAGDAAYGTGKVFHIFRPKAWDSGRDTVWCTLDIDTRLGTLTVTVPDYFLSRAVYPVTIDPHFGMDQQGASTTDFTNAYNYGIALSDYQYEATNGDRVDSLVMYFVYSADSAALAVYAVDNADKPTGSPAGSSSRIGSTANGQWRSAPVNIALTSGLTYAIVLAEAMSDGTRISYDSYARSCSRCNGASFCDPWSEAGLRAYCFSAYAVYTNTSPSAKPSGKRRRTIIEGFVQ